MARKATRKDKIAIGWREWVELPDLRVPRVKAKVDTGARSSSLHAFDVELRRYRGADAVFFSVHPIQDSNRSIRCRALLQAERWIRSSNGKRELRPVIRTELEFAGARWPIDLTLTSRDEMGFRMLLGREAVRNRFLVDPGRSFLIKDAMPRKRRRKEPR